MLQDFEHWITLMMLKLKGKGIESEFISCAISDNPGVYVDFDTEKILARITFWQSGNYYLEAIDIESEQQLFSRHGVINSPHDFSKEFSEFFNLLNDKPYL